MGTIARRVAGICSAGAFAAALAVGLAPHAGADSCGPVGPFVCGARNSSGRAHVSFTDRWAGVGFRTWTIDSSESRGFVTGPGAGVQMLLTDTYCFNKYAFGVSIGGDGLSPSVGTDDNCATRAGTGTGSVRNTGKVIGRSSPIGRWIWFSHDATLRVTIGSSNTFVSTYKRSTPNGGNV